MEKSVYKKEALNYQDEGKAYMHVEVVNGEADVLLCGDMLALLYGISCQIKRIGELRQMSIQEVVESMYQLIAIGYDNVQNNLRDERGQKKKKLIGGTDWQEEWKKEQIKNLTKKEKQLAKEVTKLQQENEKLKSINHEIKKNYANQLNFKNEQIQRLRTQTLRLEHEIKALENTEMEEEKQCIK